MFKQGRHKTKLLNINFSKSKHSMHNFHCDVINYQRLGNVTCSLDHPQMRLLAFLSYIRFGKLYHRLTDPTFRPNIRSIAAKDSFQ